MRETSGVYTATLDPTYHGLYDEDLVADGRREVFGIPRSAIEAGLSFPYLTFVSLPFYHDRRQLAKVTCIQITETKLFFVWDAMYKPENIDFFRQLGMIGRSTPPPRVEEPGLGEVEDDLEHGLFTTADTLAQAAQAAEAEAAIAGHVAEEDEGADESQALIPSGSGAGNHDIPGGAGPSTAVLDASDDHDEAGEGEVDDDDEEWEDADEGSVDGDVDDDFPELFAGIRPDSEFWPFELLFMRRGLMHRVLSNQIMCRPVRSCFVSILVRNKAA